MSLAEPAQASLIGPPEQTPKLLASPRKPSHPWLPKLRNCRLGRGQRAGTILLAQSSRLCFITHQLEVVAGIKASAQRRPICCRRGDAFSLGCDARHRSLAGPSSSPAQGRRQSWPSLFSHSVPAKPDIVGFCGRHHAGGARGSHPHDCQVWHSSISFFIRLPAAPQPRSPCRLALLFRVTPRAVSSAGIADASFS